MNDKTAYRLIGERTQELSKMPAIQKHMAEMVNNGKTKEETENWLYMCAIGTLMGIQNK